MSLLVAPLLRAQLQTMFRSKYKKITASDITGLAPNTLTPGTYEWEDVNGRKYALVVGAGGVLVSLTQS